MKVKNKMADQLCVIKNETTCQSEMKFFINGVQTSYKLILFSTHHHRNEMIHQSYYHTLPH